MSLRHFLFNLIKSPECRHNWIKLRWRCSDILCNELGFNELICFLFVSDRSLPQKQNWFNLLVSDKYPCLTSFPVNDMFLSVLCFLIMNRFTFFCSSLIWAAQIESPWLDSLFSVVHLQILLAVGLAVFCYCLVLGCILCCRRKKKSVSSEDKEAVYLSPHRAEQVTVTLTPSLCTQPVKQQYEELDGDVLEFPSSKSSSSPSEDDLPALPFDPSPNRSADLPQPPCSSFQMRRLSTPAVPCSPSKRPTHGRASLPSLTKLSLVSKSRRAVGRRSTVSGESFLYSESSQLTAAPTQQGEPGPPQYGSNSLSVPSKSAPLLHFSLLFSSTCGTLVVNILGLSGASRRRSGVFVRASLPPLCPSPQQVASRRRSLSPDLHSQSFVLQVGSVDELRTCILRLAVYSRDFSGLREAALGVVELPCEHVEWEPDTTTTYTRQLLPTKSKLKKVHEDWIILFNACTRCN